MNPTRAITESHPLRAQVRQGRLGLAALATLALACAAFASAPAHDPQELKTALLPFHELEPFVVKGEELSISVYARSNRDRRYAERLAESVVEVAYETIGKSTGHGLVIVGARDEPHPFFLFRRFLEMQRENNPQDGALAEAASALETMLNEWQAKVTIDASAKEGAGMQLDFDTILNAIPLPLEGMASTLYLLAWTEDFDDKRLENKLKSLDAAALENDGFSRYDWVFYLPPRNAFNKVIKTTLPEIMKEAELGIVKRAAIRGAIFTFKPMINDAIESLRKGILLFTVLRARGEFDSGEAETLTEAYIKAVMPRGRIIPGDKQQRAREALEAQMIANAEYAKDPFISPTPLENPDLSLYSRFEGEYGSGEKATHRFSIQDGACYWQYRDRDPGKFSPASDTLFVSEDGKMTIEMLLDSEGKLTGVRERWVRREYTIPSRP